MKNILAFYAIHEQKLCQPKLTYLDVVYPLALIQSIPFLSHDNHLLGLNFLNRTMVRKKNNSELRYIQQRLIKIKLTLNWGTYITSLRSKEGLIHPSPYNLKKWIIGQGNHDFLYRFQWDKFISIWAYVSRCTSWIIKKKTLLIQSRGSSKRIWLQIWE